MESSRASSFLFRHAARVLLCAAANCLLLLLFVIAVHVSQVSARLDDVADPALQLLGLRKAAVYLAVPERLCLDRGLRWCIRARCRRGVLDRNGECPAC